MFKKVLLVTLLASATAFNGQPPATFGKKFASSETALKMSGGNVAPALKVRYILVICFIILGLCYMLPSSLRPALLNECKSKKCGRSLETSVINSRY